MSEIWGGRFEQDLDNLMIEFNASIDVDKQLAKYDIQGSIIYADALHKAGVLNEEEFKQIVEGLKRIQDEIEKGEIEFRKELEDIHMNIEKRLNELIGNTAKKLHTGRSRNEQVVLDEKLYLKDESAQLKTLLVDYIKSLIKLAENTLEIPIPAFTHLQPAQPILFSHFFLAYAFRGLRNLRRLQFFAELMNESPIGVGAVAGTTYDLDRVKMASQLGFKDITKNSMDTTASRDFILDFLYLCSLIAIDLSNIAEDLILYSTPYFAFVELPDAYCTGSSLMPQKKNPDALELIRGRSGRLISNLNRLQIILKGLPMSYNKDLQEDKEPLFDSIKIMKQSLIVMSNILLGLKINKDILREAVKKGYLEATDIADYLVQKGVPFREAHRIVGELVKYAINKKCRFEELSLNEYKKISDDFEQDIFDFIKIDNLIARRAKEGGTSRENVIKQIDYLNKELEALK